MPPGSSPCWRCGNPYGLLVRYPDGSAEWSCCGASPTPPRPPTAQEKRMAEHDGWEGRRQEVNKLADSPCKKWAGPCGACPLPDCTWEHRGPKKLRITSPP